MDIGDNEAPKRTFRDRCRRLGTCMRVSPWIPLIGAIMIATALPIWAVFTRRALDTSKLLADSLFGGRVPAVDMLATSVQWATGLGVIIVSSVAGLCLLVSMLRTYQEAARLPNAKCGAPGRISYGSYATLISVVTFCIWAMTIAVALAIASQLAWLLMAFVFESAVISGVQPLPAGGAPPQQLFDATRGVLEALAATGKELPAKGSISESTAKFLAASSKEVGITVCPSTCFNMGSFTAAFGAANPCVCGAAEQYGTLQGAATDTWKFLVHALAALALMGLADLWLLMNLSAQFAHAKRDIGQLPGAVPSSRRTTTDGSVLVGMAANPTFNEREKKGRGGSARRQDTTTRDCDTAKAPAGASYGYVGGEPLAPPAPIDDPLAEWSAPAINAMGSAIDAEQGVGCEEAGGGGGGGGEGARGSPGRSTTAQRYAAYRLRAAQANPAKSQPKWGRN